MQTNNETALYLIEKKELEDSIKWYQQTIKAVNEQQAKRQTELFGLEYRLMKLKEKYYGA